MIDGPVARMRNEQSEAGAKLDSSADVLFVLCVGIAVVRSGSVPGWALTGASVIALIRIVAYGIGYGKYRTFASLHTVLNKAAGAILFLFPLLCRIFGRDAAALIAFGVALLSAVEELIITIQSKELDRNRKSIFKG